MVSLCASKTGVWLSIDLLLAFLILQSVLVMVLSPLLLENTYAKNRAVNAQDLSMLLSVSHRLYSSAVVRTSPPSDPLNFDYSFTSSVRWLGYHPSDPPPLFELMLPASYGSSLGAIFSPVPPPAAPATHLCISRTMLDQGHARHFWVCAPGGG